MLNDRKYIEKFFALAENISTFSTNIFFTFITIILMVEIIYRYSNLGALGWPQEISLILIVWITYLGVALHIKNRSLLKVDVLYRKFPEKAKRVIDFIFDVINLLLFLFLFKTCLDLNRIQSLKQLTTIKLPQSILTWGPLVSFCIIILIVILQLYKKIVAIQKDINETNSPT